ncbi:uncharacterized protein I206_105053 [Kwoniella pini CBS 10737]|uniref:Uncharacterized protein n=1 Tax=Kwoniella pini CBS 10737 TaxID=1296096 RepID=A0A1B9I8J6_9TREE|nr:uncharacterized protein I206_02593 [Kwoniella pini CBS 10737]OCF51877.1 hypothetical protein I206_02593 [Kwoniella pini CBS 10737]
MRVRLPPSVITQIESHVRPTFHPVLTLSNPETTLPTASRIPIPHSESWPKEKRIARPLSAPVPLSSGYFFRTKSKNQKSHLTSAHDYLSSESLEISNSTSCIRRQVTYSRLIVGFLDHPNGLEAIQSLIERSLKENIPISIPTLTSILHSTLRSEDLNDRRSIVNMVLPILPEKVDIPLLDVLLRVIIRDIHPDPSMIEKMINDCLSLPKEQKDNINDVQKGKSKGKENWPLEIWDLLFTSYYQIGDLKGSLELLEEYKQVFHNLNLVLIGEKDQRAISKVYTTIMNTWRRSKQINKEESNFPKNLAKDLVEILGKEIKPSLGFLNSWMKAEIKTGNKNNFKKVWELIEICNEVEIEKEKNLPNEESWLSLFQFYFNNCSNNIEKDTNKNKIENLIKELFKQKKLYPKSIKLNISIFEIIIKCCFKFELNLIIILNLIKKLNYFKILPNRKFIDLISSEILKNIFNNKNLTINQQVKLNFLLTNKSSFLTILKNNNSNKFEKQKKKKRMGLNYLEWDLISEIINNQQQTHKQDFIWLPLSMPIARLNYQNQNFISSHNNFSQNSSTSSSSSSLEIQNTNYQNQNLPEKVLPSLIILIEKLINFTECDKEHKSPKFETNVNED